MPDPFALNALQRCLDDDVHDGSPQLSVSSSPGKAHASQDDDDSDVDLPPVTQRRSRYAHLLDSDEDEADEMDVRLQQTRKPQDNASFVSSGSQAVETWQPESDVSAESEGEGYSLDDEDAIKAQGGASEDDTGSEYDRDLSGFVVADDYDSDEDDFQEGDVDDAGDNEYDSNEEDDFQSDVSFESDVGEENKSIDSDSDLGLPSRQSKISTSGSANSPIVIPATPIKTPLLPKQIHQPPKTPRSFNTNRDKFAAQLFDRYNQEIFDNQLRHVNIEWNKRLNTTAGRAHLRRNYNASIELSTKVIDTYEKLENTLCHEMCHAMQWCVSHTSKPAHGRVFKTWAAKAMRRFPHLHITTCHNYEINYKYTYRCTTSWCGKEYGRHSQSIDTETKGCGVCSGKLELMPRLKADGTPMKKRNPSAFSV